MDMDVDADGWDWIPSHDLHYIYVAGRVSLQSGPALLQLDLLLVSARPLVRTLSVNGHGEFRRLLRQVEPATPTPPDPATLSTLRRWTGWSRPLHAGHAELAATEATALQAGRIRRRPGRAPELPCAGRFADGVEVLKNGTASGIVLSG